MFSQLERNTMWKKLIPALCLGALLSPLAMAADLTVTVVGVQSNDGQVRVALYDDAHQFPQGTIFAGQIVPAAKGTVQVQFKNVAPGRYALSAFQDVNSNQRLDSNMMGMPTEPYGFSRDAHGDMGPPNFDAAVFTVGADKLALTIHLQ